jgi:hypothetical protein
MVSISLDAWTSPNGYAFLAIVAHYVTNDGNLGEYFRLKISPAAAYTLLEELLIDFQELIGEHSGDNMAEVVWKTLDDYKLTGRVRQCLIQSDATLC